MSESLRYTFLFPESQGRRAHWSWSLSASNSVCVCVCCKYGEEGKEELPLNPKLNSRSTREQKKSLQRIKTDVEEQTWGEKSRLWHVARIFLHRERLREWSVDQCWRNVRDLLKRTAVVGKNERNTMKELQYRCGKEDTDKVSRIHAHTHTHRRTHTCTRTHTHTNLGM